ncbi:hypothetical protein FHS38_001538 [Streptomyces netropsis]|uniref:Uncharacterized protein n=1 Tax=Streptomyces netropsis TaxID=55404 RepID=A0A7W7L8A6_STRNE|nr:hypothetical protein [Streptomyces netropsis]
MAPAHAPSAYKTGGHTFWFPVENTYLIMKGYSWDAVMTFR